MVSKRRFQSAALAGILASGIVAAGALGTTARANARATYPIAVTVDGNRINFTGTQPVELHGSVLVPLRGVFENLGASVDYDPQMQTVTAIKGDRTVIVPIGAKTASIDGAPQPLSEPAQVVNGSTLVPLRFVAEALGDYVEWGDRTHMVTITTVQPAPAVASTLPAEKPGQSDVDAAAANVVRGVVRQVIADADPRQIIVRVNGEDQEIPITDHAAIFRGRVGRDGESVALANVQPGDRVVIRQNDDGAAVRISSSFGLVYGTVSSINISNDGSRTIVLSDGTSMDIAPSARVMRDGTSIEAVDLNPGDHVTIATDPQDNVAYRITVNPPIYAHRR